MRPDDVLGSDVVATGRAVVDRIRDDEVTFLAAAIAYYAFVSVLPALLLVLVVASALGGAVLVDRVLATSDAYLAPAGEAALADAITNARGRAGATVVGVAVLAWTTLRVFRGLDIAFARVYGTSDTKTFVEEIRNAVLVVVAIGAGIGGMVVVGTVLAAADLPVRGEVLGLALLWIALVVVLLPLYYLLPDRPVSLREVLPGTFVAAAGWILLQAAFQVYAAAAPRYDLYGVIGGVLLLVTWFYVAAIAILIGAVVNDVLAEDRQVQHVRTRRAP